MAIIDLQELKETYLRDGFVYGVEILDAMEAAEQRGGARTATLLASPMAVLANPYQIGHPPATTAIPPASDIPARMSVFL